MPIGLRFATEIILGRDKEAVLPEPPYLLPKSTDFCTFACPLMGIHGIVKKSPMRF